MHDEPHQGSRRKGRQAALSIVIGALFAADTLLELSVAPRLWPLLVTMLSAGLIGISLSGARREVHSA